MKAKEILEGIEVVIKHDGTLEFDAKELKILLDYITTLQRKEYNNSKAIKYITSEETINTFSSINAREKWLKINHKLLNILEKGE